MHLIDYIVFVMLVPLRSWCAINNSVLAAVEIHLPHFTFILLPTNPRAKGGAIQNSRFDGQFSGSSGLQMMGRMAVF